MTSTSKKPLGPSVAAINALQNTEQDQSSSNINYSVRPKSQRFSTSSSPPKKQLPVNPQTPNQHKQKFNFHQNDAPSQPKPALHANTKKRFQRHRYNQTDTNQLNSYPSLPPNPSPNDANHSTALSMSYTTHTTHNNRKLPLHKTDSYEYPKTNNNIPSQHNRIHIKSHSEAHGNTYTFSELTMTPSPPPPHHSPNQQPLTQSLVTYHDGLHPIDSALDIDPSFDSYHKHNNNHNKKRDSKKNRSKYVPSPATMKVIANAEKFGNHSNHIHAKQEYKYGAHNGQQYHEAQIPQNNMIFDENNEIDFDEENKMSDNHDRDETDKLSAAASDLSSFNGVHNVYDRWTLNMAPKVAQKQRMLSEVKGYRLKQQIIEQQTHRNQQQISNLRDEIVKLETILNEKKKRLAMLETENLEHCIEQIKPITLLKRLNQFCESADANQLDLIQAILTQKVD